jgi:hypothetical protein
MPFQLSYSKFLLGYLMRRSEIYIGIEGVKAEAILNFITKFLDCNPFSQSTKLRYFHKF